MTPYLFTIIFMKASDLGLIVTTAQSLKLSKECLADVFMKKELLLLFVQTVKTRYPSHAVISRGFKELSYCSIIV